MTAKPRAPRKTAAAKKHATTRPAKQPEPEILDAEIVDDDAPGTAVELHPTARTTLAPRAVGDTIYLQMLRPVTGYGAAGDTIQLVESLQTEAMVTNGLAVVVSSPTTPVIAPAPTSIRWQPYTRYPAAWVVVNPSGQIVSANTDFVSGGSYSAGNWTVINDVGAGGGGGVTTFQGRAGAVTLTKVDVTGTSLAAGDVGADPAGAAAALKLIPTATKTAPYTASVGDLVLVDPTGRTLVDLVVGSGATAATSASGELLAKDNGQIISGEFIPAGTTISYTSASAGTLSAVTTGAVSAANASRKVNIEGNATVTLPASAAAGAVVEVKNLGWGTATARVVPAGGDDIDGLSSVSWRGKNASRRFVKGSGTSWVAAGGLTPLAGPTSAKYVKSLDLYLPTDDALESMRSKFTAARVSGVPLKALWKGDSTTYGVLGARGNGTTAIYNPSSLTAAKDINAMERLRKRLNGTNILNARVDSVYSGSSVDLGIAGSRFTQSGGLTASAVAVNTFDGATKILTLTDEQTANAWDVTMYRPTGATPSGATYAVDGAGAVSLDTSGLTTSNAFVTVRVPAGSLGTHTLVITGPTSGQFVIERIVPVQTATPALMQLRNGGVSGQTLATYAGSTGIGSELWAHLKWPPDITRIQIGINDMHTWAAGSGTVAAGVAAFQTNYATTIAALKAVGSDIILSVYPSYNYAAQGFGAYEAYLWHQAIYDLAETYSLPVFDLARRWGYGYGPVDYAGTSKWPMFDGTHPTLIGYEDIASAEHNLLSLLAA